MVVLVVLVVEGHGWARACSTWESVVLVLGVVVVAVLVVVSSSI